MQKKHEFTDFNDYIVLRIKTVPILFALLLTKYIFFVIVPYIPIVDLSFLKPILYKHVNMYLLFSCLPALLFIFSAIRRIPEAGQLMRWLWKHGRLLLFASALSEFIILSLSLFLNKVNPNLLTFGFLYIDAIILYYLFKAKYLRAMLSEFPEPLKNKKQP